MVRTVSRKVKLADLSIEEVMEVIHFINLFGDYAYQREAEDAYLLTLHREKEIRTFFDYAYDNYVWDNPKHAGYRSLKELDYLRFDEEAFRKTIRQMLRLFMDNTVVWKEH